MTMNEAALAAELQARNGVTTLARLQRIGITERASRTLVRRGRLCRVARGVFVGAGWPDSLDHRIVVACAITGGVVCFPTAGLVWGLRMTPGSPFIHVWVEDHRRVAEPEGVRIHHTNHLPGCDVVQRADGSKVTSPPRTAFDAGGLLDVHDLESLVEHGIDLRYFVISTLWAVHRRARSRGRAGSGRVAAVLSARDAWQRPVRSDHELRLERAMRRRGFPPLVREHRLELPNGEVIHPDLGIPGQGFFVEVDHLTWHGRRRQSAYDRKRDLTMRACGYTVERVTDVALDHHLDATIEELWRIWQGILRS